MTPSPVSDTRLIPALRDTPLTRFCVNFVGLLSSSLAKAFTLSEALRGGAGSDFCLAISGAAQDCTAPALSGSIACLQPSVSG